jgi:5-methylcytosine-specific restriction enzyme A
LNLQTRFFATMTSSTDYFIITASPETVRREKDKARALRKTQWWQRQIGKGVCHYCGKPTPAKELTMDHVVPLIREGRTTRGNVVPACKPCNDKKKYLLPIEWEEYLRNLSGKPDSEGKTQD